MDQYVGKQLGSYRLLEQIGQGGMATIYKAYQPSMDRYVAVKILPRHFSEDETFVARFTQEAHTLARLEHPHILPVHDYGEQEGITYLVMRYVDGGTLKDLIAQRGPVDLQEVTRILGQIGRALGYAHSQDIVHRDIKPSNVMLDKRGDTFLTDFGIAKLIAGTSQFTATGAVVGTPAYMSPEQGLGETVDHRSDIYSLGVVLYELVTGQVPYEAETPLAVLLKHINDPLPPPRHIMPDLPEPVERVILKAMAKSPDDRFQKTEEMVEALQQRVAELPVAFDLPRPSEASVEPTVPDRMVSAVPIPSREPLPEKVSTAPSPRSVPWLPIAGVVVLLAVGLLFALFVLPNMGSDAPSVTPTSEAQATEQAVVLTPDAPSLTESPPGWTSYTNGNFVRALVRHEDFLWAGGSGGLVRWNLNDGSYVKYGAADGLASGIVNDLLLDRDGYLWVATESGLNRSSDTVGSVGDDETWLTFDMADGLDSDRIRTLLLDNDGALWVGTEGGEHGLSYYDGTRWGPPPIPALPGEFPSVRLLAMEKNYGLWAVFDANRLAYFDGVGWSTFGSDDGLPGDFVYDLLLTDDDELWVSSNEGVVRRDADTGEWQVISQLEGMTIYVLHQDSAGNFWFAGDEGVTRYDPQLGDWEALKPRSGDIPARRITRIIEDERGLWLGTDGGGVTLYDGDNGQAWVTDDGLGGNDIFAIRQDGSGAVWFTHPGSGLSRYDPSSDSWQTFGDSDGAEEWPYEPGVDGDGNLWIGGYGQLSKYDGRTWQSVQPEGLADAGSVFSILFGADGVEWFWTDTGLIRHDSVTDTWDTFTAEDHPVLGAVTQTYVALDGTVWAGGEYGLVQFDGERWRAPDAAGDAPEKDVKTVIMAPDGTLWVVADGALYRLEAGQWRRLARPDDAWIEALAIGHDGTIWVGYENLAHYNPLDGRWQIFTTDDGLIHEYVQAIYVTSDGVVWVGTAAGVSRYVPEE